MKDKSKTSIVIGELIKRELKKQGKTSVWQPNSPARHPYGLPEN